MWTEVFRELNAQDIGFWICEGDEVAAVTFNPKIKFGRKKTFMDGVECCDNIFYLSDKDH
jgi:hypothetical protein